MSTRSPSTGRSTRVLLRQLRELEALASPALVDARYQKFRQMGRLGREFLSEPLQSSRV